MMGRPLMPLRHRLWRNIIEAPSGCWIWMGRLDKDGYGRTHVGSITAGNLRTRAAHRVVYEEYVGSIPEGLQIDHLCRIRRCVNPRHLQPVTSRINTLRGNSVGATARQTGHCKRLHPLSGDNLMLTDRGHRHCKTCQRMKQREWQRAHAKGPRPVQTHCIHGHPLDDAYVAPRGSRECRVCRREIDRRRRDRRRKAVAS